jgi:hypothetical protein
MSSDPSPPEDLIGTKYLRSVGWAAAFTVVGAAFGYFVELAADSGPEARAWAGALAVAAVAAGAALAFVEGRKHGVEEAAGRALRAAVDSSWRGAWLGGLIGGGLAVGGGAAMISAVVVAVAVGGLAGYLIGRRRHGPALGKALNLGLSAALIGGFIAAAWWGAPGTPKLALPAVAAAAAEPSSKGAVAPPAEPDPLTESPAFGPSADWIWRMAGALPLAAVGVVWWLRQPHTSLSAEAPGRGWAMATVIFVGAMAAGLGAVVGAGLQWGVGELALGGGLAPTPGKWVGACLGLFSWGLRQQPIKPAS